MHLVDRVVHRGDQVTDVAAIERRDECAANRQMRLAGDGVGLMFLTTDFLTADEHAVAAVQQVAQGVRSGDERLRMPLEKIEEALLSRHERLKPRQHGALASRNLSQNRHKRASRHIAGASFEL